MFPLLFIIAFIAALVARNNIVLTINGILVGWAVGTVLWTLMFRFGYDVLSLNAYFLPVFLSSFVSVVLLKSRSQ